MNLRFVIALLASLAVVPFAMPGAALADAGQIAKAGALAPLETEALQLCPQAGDKNLNLAQTSPADCCKGHKGVCGCRAGKIICCDGTQRVRKAIEPIGDSKADWVIICELARKMGATGFDFTSPAEIMAEVNRLTPSYGGITHARLENGERLQWPCPATDHPGTPILHTKQFARGRGKFQEVEQVPPAELLDRVLADSAYAAELAGPGLAQARENLNKVRGLVRRIQNRGYATLGRLADHFAELVSGGDESNAIIDAVDAVNLMTVHAAKGLEFRISRGSFTCGNISLGGKHFHAPSRASRSRRACAAARARRSGRLGRVLPDRVGTAHFGANPAGIATSSRSSRCRCRCTSRSSWTRASAPASPWTPTAPRSTSSSTAPRASTTWRCTRSDIAHSGSCRSRRMPCG